LPIEGHLRKRLARNELPGHSVKKNMQIKTAVASIDNIVEVPGPGEEFEAMNPVPHGEIRQVYYQSSILGETRRMHIYTPPDYNTSQEKYPVLYLINGVF